MEGGDLRSSSSLYTGPTLPTQTSNANFVSQVDFSIGMLLYFLGWISKLGSCDLITTLVKWWRQSEILASSAALMIRSTGLSSDHFVSHTTVMKIDDFHSHCVGGIIIMEAKVILFETQFHRNYSNNIYLALIMCSSPLWAL